MIKSAPVTLLGLTVVAALLLTGCAAGPSSLAPSVSADIEPTVVEPAPTPAPVTGDIVDADLAAALKEEAAGQRGYPVDDGTFVVVNKNEPLPEVVQADIDVKAAAILAPVTDVRGENLNRTLTEPPRVQSSVAKNTGKRVLVGWKAYGYRGFDENASHFWYVTGGPEMSQHYFSREETRAAIDAWLATKEDASVYAVVLVG